MAQILTPDEVEGGGFRCPGCGHVHTRAGEILVTPTGAACAGCHAAVQFSESTMQRGVSRLLAHAPEPKNPAREFAKLLAGLRSTTEVVVLAVAPECLTGRVETVRSANGVALVDTRSGQEWHLSHLDALNLLASLARDVEIPAVVSFAKRIAL
jgi:hypothetical protein